MTTKQDVRAFTTWQRQLLFHLQNTVHMALRQKNHAKACACLGEQLSAACPTVSLREMAEANADDLVQVTALGINPAGALTAHAVIPQLAEMLHIHLSEIASSEANGVSPDVTESEIGKLLAELNAVDFDSLARRLSVESVKMAAIVPLSTARAKEIRLVKAVTAVEKSFAPEVADLLKRWESDAPGTVKCDSHRAIAKRVQQALKKSCSAHTVKSAFSQLGWLANSKNGAVTKRRRIVSTENAPETADDRLTSEPETLSVQQAEATICKLLPDSRERDELIDSLMRERVQPSIAVETARMAVKQLRAQKADARAPKPRKMS